MSPISKKKLIDNLPATSTIPKASIPTTPQSDHDVKEFMTDMFKSVNKELGENALVDLSVDDSAIVVKRFVSTGSKQLDYGISNNNMGGFPEGRITEICGPTASGKTTLALVAAASVQKMGGVVIYIDSEQALNPKRAQALGVNLKERFAYSPETCTERVFDLIEKTVLRVKNLQKDIPTLVVWDSVAATSPKGELEAEYEQNTIGLQARALRKGLRKINQILAGQKVTFVILNHITQKIGVLYGSPDTTTGGTAIPFWSSVRVKISNPSPIKKTINGAEEIVGVAVSAKVIKNKVERPWREVSFDIMFEEGINEVEHIFDTLREFCDRNKDKPILVNGKKVSISGTGAWKEFTVSNPKSGEVFITEKFYKSEFRNKILSNPNYQEYVQGLLDACYIINSTDVEHVTLGKPEFEAEAENLIDIK